MRHVFESGGIVMYPLLVIGIGVLLLAGRTAWLLARRERSAADVDQRLQAILFWGALSVVLGLLGTTIGFAQMAQAITLAGAVEPRLVWGGVAVALVSVICGLLIFVVALILWAALRQWSHHLAARARRSLPAT